MNSSPRDVAQIRLDNALILFEEFVHATIKHADAATLRGLEGRFAERLQIQPSYWSQIKGRSRQIGERLARQFEQLCKKPNGWMDETHTPNVWNDPSLTLGNGDAKVLPDDVAVSSASRKSHEQEGARTVPQDDDERFIVGLVLTYYRGHPQRARSRLLDLLGEVLTPAPAPITATRTRSTATGAAPPNDDGIDLWTKTQAAVKPLKSKR